jgi:hypothetical protein
MSTTPNIQITELGGADDASAAGMHLRKILQADAAGPANARCSTTESIMVALALCNRKYLPEGLAQTHAGHLWWRLDDSQRSAIQTYAKNLSKGGPDASASRLC